MIRFNSWTWRHMWVEFVDGSRPCSKRFLSGYSSFSPSSIPIFQTSNSIWRVSPIRCFTVNTVICLFIKIIILLNPMIILFSESDSISNMMSSHVLINPDFHLCGVKN